jgi:hypothetical protein
LVFGALRAILWVWVHSWHATTTINSSLASEDVESKPKRLAKRTIASNGQTMVKTLWSTALACIVGGSRIAAVRQGTDQQALARVRAWFLGKIFFREKPTEDSFC